MTVSALAACVGLDIDAAENRPGPCLRLLGRLRRRANGSPQYLKVRPVSTREGRTGDLILKN